MSSSHATLAAHLPRPSTPRPLATDQRQCAQASLSKSRDDWELTWYRASNHASPTVCPPTLQPREPLPHVNNANSLPHSHPMGRGPVSSEGPRSNDASLPATMRVRCFYPPPFR
jgi:hypothetical protein